MTARRPLSRTHHGVLDGLRRHGSWSPDRRVWVWSGVATTRRLLNQLLGRGLVTLDGDGVYRISATGLEALGATPGETEQ